VIGNRAAIKDGRESRVPRSETEVEVFEAEEEALVKQSNRVEDLAPNHHQASLGVLILAMVSRRATATGACWGLIAGMAVVPTVAFSPWTRDIAFLWNKVIRAVVVVIVGRAVSALR